MQRPTTAFALSCALAVCVACGSDRIAAPDPVTDAPAETPVPPAPPPPPNESQAQEPEPAAPPPPPPQPPTQPAAPAVLVGAGDIAHCGTQGAQLTAALLDRIDGMVFTAGDHAYSNGTREDFLNCYEPTWGRHRGRTRPSPGNHDYRTPHASAYFEYFGSNAGPAGLGYYTFTAGAWRVYSLNSNISAGSGSAQLSWLRAQLTAHPSTCIAAIWHHPITSSGRYGGEPAMRDVWRTLHEFGADVVVTAHEHLYERFARLDANGFPSPDGIRAFIVGTGGAPLYEFGHVAPGSEARGAAWGVLKLTLLADGYEWEFVPVDGATFRDRGAGSCQ